MNKNITGALVIFVLVVIGAIGVKLIFPKYEAKQQKATSDAARTKGKIKIAIDNWIGYFLINSPEMKNLMRKSGYTLICEDDHADYKKRMERLKKGEINFAVATVDSYILNAAQYNYPGTIIMVIDESKGGDAILARQDKVAGLTELQGKKDIRIAFTPESPSHYFLKSASDHFNLPELLPVGDLRVETDGSAKARKKLLSGEADIAVCWEPDVSLALKKKGMIKLLGTEDTEKLIVDILIVNRKYAQDKPEVVLLVINNYFKALKKYRNNNDLLIKDVGKTARLDSASVKSMLKGVHWVNFNENCEKWFGIAGPGSFATEGLIETIESTAGVLISAGDFSANPFPDEDPYGLTNSSFLEKLFAKGITGFTLPRSGNGNSIPLNSIETRFTELDDAGWNSLKEVGTLKVEPIIFQHGAFELDLLAKKVVDQVVERLKHYPNFRIIIKGHTSIRGDQQENLNLSQERADSVARYLNVVYNVDQNRMKAIGFGGLKPLAKKSGESRRSFLYRLPRVELSLVQEDF